MGNSKKRFNKVVIHYTDRQSYTVKNVDSIYRDLDTLTVANFEKGRRITQDIPMNDILYAVHYDEYGDIKVYNGTSLPVEVTLKDRAYRRLMQAKIGKYTLGEVIESTKLLQELDLDFGAPVVETEISIKGECHCEGTCGAPVPPTAPEAPESRKLGDWV